MVQVLWVRADSHVVDLTYRETAMSFVGAPYTYDIFISYNHGDVRGEGTSNFLRWSKCFWQALRSEFAALRLARGW